MNQLIINNQTLIILQVNLNNARASTSLAANYIQENKIDIALIQDAYHTEKGIFGFPSSWPTYHSRNKKAWAVVCNPNIISSYSSNTETTIIINIQQRLGILTLGSQYVSPVEDIEEQLLNLTEKIPQAHPFIMAADYNARSQLWGYGFEDSRGQRLQEFAASHNLFFQNSSNDPPTFRKDNRKGWPDITLANALADEKINSWQVSEETTLSDHQYIIYTLNERPSNLTRRRYKTEHSTHKKFGHLFNQHLPSLQLQLSKVNNSSQLDIFTAQLIKSIQHCCDRSYRKKAIGKKPKFTWWSQELRTKRNRLTALTRKMQKMAPEDQTPLRQLIKKDTATYKKDIIQAKRKNWIEFCSKTSDKFGTQFKLAHGKNYVPDEILVDWPTGPTLSKQETLERLTNFHFPQMTKEQESSDHTGPNHHFPPEALPTDMEIADAVRSINSKKAPGPDSIDGRVLKYLHSKNSNLINTWVRKCYQLGTFPDSLKTGEVVFFLKKGKDAALPESYRPICLLPSLGKLLEKILVNRLNYHLERSQLFSKDQFGFREALSTEHAIEDALAKLKKTRNTNKYGALISIDIKGAFDNLLWPELLKSMHDLNIPYMEEAMSSSYLSKRFLQVHWGTGSKLHRVSKGCPQGSCLGPTLWKIMLNDLLQILQAHKIKATAYADDLLIITGGTTRKELEMSSNAALQLISHWLNKAGLEISREKTTATIFGKLKRTPIIKLDNNNIKITKYFKYLGITIDNQLNWLKHIEALKLKSNALINNILRLAPATWGISANMLKTWYLAVTEKVLGYGAAIWSNNLSKAARLKLASLQRQHLLRISRAYVTTPTEALNVTTGLPPLELQLQKIAKRTSLFQLRKDTKIGPNTYKPTEIMLKIPKYTMHPGTQINNLVIQPMEEDIEKQKSAITENPATTHIFTDGSRIGEGVGAALVIFHKGSEVKTQKFKLNSYNTVFQAEALALLKAIDWVAANKPKKAIIHSDSKSSIEAIKQHRPQHQIIRKIHQSLLTTTELITLSWIKAHAGIPGNERADDLAKEAAQQNLPKTELQIPPSYIKKELKRELQQAWQRTWDLSEKGRKLYVYKQKVSTEYHLLHRETIFCVTGHGPFPEYLHRFNLSRSPNCICGEIGNAQHYMHECQLTRKFHLPRPQPGYEPFWLQQVEERAQHFGRLKSLIRLLMNDALSFADTS